MVIVDQRSDRILQKIRILRRIDHAVTVVQDAVLHKAGIRTADRLDLEALADISGVDVFDHHDFILAVLDRLNIAVCSGERRIVLTEEVKLKFGLRTK